MENQTAQNANPAPPVSPVVQTPEQTPPVLNPKKKLPIFVIGIILFVLITGSAVGFYFFKQVRNTKNNITPKNTINNPNTGDLYQDIKVKLIEKFK